MPGIFHTITLEELSQWPKPNYVDPVERSWLSPFAIAWTIVSTALVAARIVLRIQGRSGTFGWDDVFIIIGWAFAVALAPIACILEWEYDIGRHTWDVPPEHYGPALYWAWIAQVMFIHSSGATKTSVLLFFHRMVKDSYNRKWLYAVYVLLFITVGSWVSMFLAYCFMCQPLSAFWNVYNLIETGGSKNYTCVDGEALTIAIGVVTIASDFYAVAFPCTLFYHYDLGSNRRQKIALNVIFCLGFLVTGVGIARTYYLWKIGHSSDLDWVGYDLYAASIVEVQLAIICTCAPFLRSVLRKFGGTTTQAPSDGRTAGGARSGATEGCNDGTITTTTVSRMSRISSRHAGTRTSFLAATPLRAVQRSPSPFTNAEEKAGYLVKDEGSGRLVWNSKQHSKEAPPASATSNTSVMFPTEPLSPV